jgi:hypothetical protein
MKTDTSVDTEKIKEHADAEVVLSPDGVVTNVQSCKPFTRHTEEKLCIHRYVGLIDGTAELATEVRCGDRTHEDLIGMLIEPTHCVLWITWRGLQCEAALGLVHPEETTLQTVPIHEDCVVVEVIIVYTIFLDELLQYPPNDEVMKLGQAQGQMLQWRRCRIDIKGAPTCKSRSQATVQIPCSSHITV